MKLLSPRDLSVINSSVRYPWNQILEILTKNKVITLRRKLLYKIKHFLKNFEFPVFYLKRVAWPRNKKQIFDRIIKFKPRGVKIYFQTPQTSSQLQLNFIQRNPSNSWGLDFSAEKFIIYTRRKKTSNSVLISSKK